MNLKLENLTEDHAKQICNWKYEGIYSVYNFPDWNTVVKQKWGISIKQKRDKEFVAVVDNCNSFCGYIRFIENADNITVGLGLEPSSCGKGLGSELMNLLKSESRKRYGEKEVMLEVRTFNKRAINCYKNAGFKIVDIYKKDTLIGSDEFFRMEYTY